MTAIRRPDNAMISPDRLAHRLWHDGIISRGQGKHRAFKLLLNPSHVPLRQPIQPLFEARDIERLWPGETSSAARVPKRLERSAGIALEPAFQGRQARRRDMAAEAIEALHADKGFVAPSAVLKQPQEAQRMPHCDGIFRPLRHALWPTRDKAEIDEGNSRSVEMGDEVSKEAGVKAPAMNEHKTHLWLVYIPLARRGTDCPANVSNSRSTSASSCTAVNAKRSRAVPAGTVGGLIATAQNPALRSRALIASAASGEPRMTGTICVVDAPVLRPSALAPSRKSRASFATWERSALMPQTRSRAASVAPSTGGGKAVE